MTEKISSHEARRIVLEEFSGLTRHKPAALDDRFGLSLRIQEGTLSLNAAFGKRHAAMETSAAALDMNPEQFRQVVAKPLAGKLLASA